MAEITNDLAKAIALGNDAQNYQPVKRNPIALDRQTTDNYHDRSITTDRVRNAERSPRNSDQADVIRRKDDFREVLEKRLSRHQESDNSNENSNKDQKAKNDSINQTEIPVYVLEKPRTKEQIITQLANKSPDKTQKNKSNIVLKDQKFNNNNTEKNVISESKNKVLEQNKLVDEESTKVENKESLKNISKSTEETNRNNSETGKNLKQAVKDETAVAVTDKKAEIETAINTSRQNNDNTAEVSVEKSGTVLQPARRSTPQTENLNTKNEINQQNINKDSGLENKSQNKTESKIENNIDLSKDIKKDKSKKPVDEIIAENAQEKIQLDQVFSEPKAANNTQVSENNLSKPSAASDISPSPTTSSLSAGGLQRPSEQIVENIQAMINGPEREITITLNPAELGRVRIRFAQQQGEVTGMLEVEKTHTQQEIQRQVPEIIAAVQGNGVQIRKIEVVQQQPQNQNSGQNQDSKEDIPHNFNPDAEHSNSKQDNENKGNNPRSFRQDITDYSPEQRRKTSVETLSEDEINVYL